jgi:hypothetical protein
VFAGPFIDVLLFDVHGLLVKVELLLVRLDPVEELGVSDA